MANQKYTSIKNDYSIVFDKQSEIEEVDDDASIQNRGFCFTTIQEINDFEQMRTIDAIGIITQVGILTQVNIKQSGAVKDRRNICIADESNLSIQVSLWGANARTDGYTDGQVLALRGARVSDYNGKSLNSGDEHSQMFIDPDHKRARELRNWYELHKSKNLSLSSVTINATIITNGVAAAANGSLCGTLGPGGERSDNFKLSEELIEELSNPPSRSGLNGSTMTTFLSDPATKNQTKFYKISGFVKMIFNDEKILYLSCPDCRKKVIEEDGSWRCENCNKLHSINLPTYMLSALISDVSGNVMV